MQKATNKVVELKTQEKQPWEQEWARCKPFIEKAVKSNENGNIWLELE